MTKPTKVCDYCGESLFKTVNSTTVEISSRTQPPWGGDYCCEECAEAHQADGLGSTYAELEAENAEADAKIVELEAEKTRVEAEWEAELGEIEHFAWRAGLKWDELTDEGKAGVGRAHYLWAMGTDENHESIECIRAYITKEAGG